MTTEPFLRLEGIRKEFGAFAALRDIRLEVDGGIKVDNIGAVAAAGADTFVAGSAIFSTKDYATTIAAMRAQLAKNQAR